MRYIIILVMIVFSTKSFAQVWEDEHHFNKGADGITLHIISSTDRDLFTPLIEGFISQNQDISIRYMVTGTANLYERFRQNPQDFDIAISSAMDLQLKLTNDGFALKLHDVAHPDWAEWRQSLFGFTSEPAAIVLNRAAFEGVAIPQSRQELIEALRARPEVFRGKVGTYDVRQSGLGYLFATQDARASETFWRLMEVIGSLDVHLYCCSGEMIDDLINGEIAVAYNVLGSYAAARAQSQSALVIVHPSDFPTTMMRTAFVSKQTKEAAAATRFIRYLIDQQSNPQTDTHALPPLNLFQNRSERATIALEPALMTFLDNLKRQKFLSEWESALIQN